MSSISLIKSYEGLARNFAKISHNFSVEKYFKNREALLANFSDVSCAIKDLAGPAKELENSKVRKGQTIAKEAEHLAGPAICKLNGKMASLCKKFAQVNAMCENFKEFSDKVGEFKKGGIIAARFAEEVKDIEEVVEDLGDEIVSDADVVEEAVAGSGNVAFCPHCGEAIELVAKQAAEAAEAAIQDEVEAGAEEQIAEDVIADEDLVDEDLLAAYFAKKSKIRKAFSECAETAACKEFDAQGEEFAKKNATTAGEDAETIEASFAKLRDVVAHFEEEADKLDPKAKAFAKQLFAKLETQDVEFTEEALKKYFEDVQGIARCFTEGADEEKTEKKDFAEEGEDADAEETDEEEEETIEDNEEDNTTVDAANALDELAEKVAEVKKIVTGEDVEDETPDGEDEEEDEAAEDEDAEGDDDEGGDEEGEGDEGDDTEAEGDTVEFTTDDRPEIDPDKITNFSASTGKASYGTHLASLFGIN